MDFITLIKSQDIEVVFNFNFEVHECHTPEKKNFSFAVTTNKSLNKKAWLGSGSARL